MAIHRCLQTMALLVCMIALLLPRVDPGPPVSYGAVPERELFGRINAERMRNGSPQLAWSGTLASVAASYAREIAATRNVSHVSLKGSTPWDRVIASHYYDFYIGTAHVSEIIEVHEGSPDPDFTFSGIMGSPEHRTALLSRNVSEAGIGIASFSCVNGPTMRSFVVCVQIFAYRFSFI